MPARCARRRQSSTIRSARLPGSSDPVRWSDVQRRRAEPRRHRQRVARRNRRRIAADALGEQRGQPRLLEHVEVVVRRGAVGADADVDAELQHLRDRRDAGRRASGCWSGCARRRRRNSSARGSRLRPRARSARRAPSRRTGPACCTQGTPGMPWRRRDSSTSSSVSDRWMCSGTSNSAASSAQERRISGVQVYGACGAGAGHDQRMALPALDELARARQRLPRSCAASGAGKRSTVCPHSARMPASAVASATASSK